MPLKLVIAVVRQLMEVLNLPKRMSPCFDLLLTSQSDSNRG